MQSKIIFRQLFDYETWTYTYLLADPETREAALIDTVLEQADRDLLVLKELNLNLKYTIETHIHADHVTAASVLRDKTGSKVCVSSTSGVACVDILLEDGQILNLGSHQIKAITTPGHTNTCMSFYCCGMVFTGDTLFYRDVGRTDFQQGSNEKMFDSIRKKLFTLPEETKVYPGHDYKGFLHSTIAEEKKWNPKVSLANNFDEFKEKMLAMKLGQPKKIHIAVPRNLECGR